MGAYFDFYELAGAVYDKTADNNTDRCQNSRVESCSFIQRVRVFCEVQRFPAHVLALKDADSGVYYHQL